MNDLTQFAFEGKHVRITDQNCEPWFVLKDVLAAMDSKTHTTDAVESIKDVFGDEVVGDVPIADNLGRMQNTLIISEPAVTYLLSRSNTEEGKRLNRFIHIEILPSIRKTGSYSIQKYVETKSDIMIKIAESAARMLRMSDTSKIRMLSEISKIEGIEPKFLPSYVDEALVKAATALLKEHGSSLSAKAFNIILIDMQILEELTRNSSSGSIKKFKSLTDKGLEYGRNETSPNNPRETQPLYYTNKFSKLLELVEQHINS